MDILLHDAQNNFVWFSKSWSIGPERKQVQSPDKKWTDRFIKIRYRASSWKRLRRGFWQNSKSCSLSTSNESKRWRLWFDPYRLRIYQHCFKMQHNLWNDLIHNIRSFKQPR
jgi:hypothetical protein